MLIIVILFYLLDEIIVIIDSSEHIYISILQHELLRVLYPVFIHCFMELVARGYIQEGILCQLCFGCILIFVREFLTQFFYFQHEPFSIVTVKTMR